MSKPTSLIDADTTLSFTPELLKALQAFLSFIKHGVGIQEIFDVETALGTQDVLAAQLTYLKSHPEIAQLFEERYLAPPPNLEELLKLPEDSLGYAYASNLQAVNYHPDYFPQVEVQDDASYYSQRMRQTHDIWHTVSGYGLSIFGGLGLAAFQFANNRDPLAAILMAGEILNNINMQRDLGPVILIFKEGYDLGYHAKPFLAQKWEEAWEKPLAEWRSELNVPAVRKYQTIADAAQASSVIYPPTFGNLSSQTLRPFI